MKKYLNDNFNFDNPELVSSIDELSIWSAPFGMKMLDVIEMKTNMNYLDVGFGTGFPLIEIVQRLGPTCTATGIDPWIGAHERTKAKLKQYGLTNVSLHNGTAEKMAFDDNTFNLITSNNGLNNVENEPAAYAECYRVCKTNGQFVFTYNLPETFAEFYLEFEKVLTDFGQPSKIEKLRAHIHKKRKTIVETKEIVLNNGFKIEQIITDSFKWRYTDGSAMLNHWFIRLAFLDSWIEIPEKEDQEKIFDELEKRINKEAEKNGCFNMTIPFTVFNCKK